MNALEQEVRGLTRTLREAVSGLQGARDTEADPERLAQAMDLLARRVAAEIAATRQGIASDLTARLRDEVRQAMAAELDARRAPAPPTAAPSEPAPPAGGPPRTDVEELRARIWGEGGSGQR